MPKTCASCQWLTTIIITIIIIDVVIPQSGFPEAEPCPSSESDTN